MSEKVKRHPGFSLRPSPFDVLLALFMLSAFVGTQTAYAPGPAWAKFWLIVGACGLYYAVVHLPDIERLYGALAIAGLLGVAVTVWFFLTIDWDAVPIKVPVLTELGRSISDQLPVLAIRRINPNIFGGVLAMLLPVYVLLVSLPRRGAFPRWPDSLVRLLPVIWSIAAGVVLVGVLVTTSRGAWLATLVGFALWGLWGWLGRRVTPQVRLKWMIAILILGGVFAAVACYAILVYEFPGAGALTGRLTLFKDSLLLARDYVLTGAGLGTFQMNFSIYTLLIHVGYIVNGHNIFINLLVEQGMMGLGAYLGLVILCFSLGVRALFHASWYQSRVTEAGLVSLTVLLVHSQVEDVIYGSQWIFLLFIPFALVRWAVKRIEVVDVSRSYLIRRGMVVACELLIVAGVVFWRPLLAQGYASLGAMRQARVELARYEFGQSPGFIMDPVRQEVDLTESIALYEQAIVIDPGNATARQRLAGIYLSRGAYDAALQHLEVAGAAGHHDSVTRLLLGDALFALGYVDEAAKVVAGLPWATTRLEGQAWSRYWDRGDFARAAYAWYTIALLQPQHAEIALQRAQEAEMRVQP